MSLTVGELTGFVDLDTAGVTRGAAAGEAATARMARAVLSDLRKIEAQGATVELDADGSAVTREVAAAVATVRGFDGVEATARLKVDADTSGVDYYRDATGRLRNMLGQFMSDAEKAERGLDGFGSSASRAGGHADALRGRVDGLADGLSRLGPAAMGFSAAGLIPVLMGTAAAASSLQGVVGLLPATGLSAAVGIGALKVATAGWGDAMSSMGDPEKFAESLEKLSPRARTAATAIRGLAPAWKAMQSQVQDRFFSSIGDQVSQLGGIYIPMLGRGFDSVAGSANLAMTDVLAFLGTAGGIQDVNSIVGSGAAVWANLLGAVKPLVPALLDMGVVGGGVLAELTSGVGGAAERFRGFIAAARGSGQLERWIRGGVSAVEDLMGILGNLGRLVGSVFSAANQNGAGLLQTVRDITAGWATWAASAEGQARMGEVFAALNQILTVTSGALQVLLPIVADLIVWFSQLPGPVQSAVVGFVTWGMIAGKLLGVLSPLISVLGFIGPKIASIGGSIVMAAARWGLLGTAAQGAAAATNASALSVVGAWLRMAASATLNALKTAGAWLLATGANAASAVASTVSSVASILAQWARMAAAAAGHALRTAGAWLLTTGANAAAAVAATVSSVASIIAQWVVMAAAATAHALRTAGAWLLTTGAAAAGAVATMVSTAAAVVAQWAMMALQAMARAVVMAAAWLVAMGPIGWIIAAVVALVALIIANWDTVKAWTIAAWNAVSDAVVAAWEWIKSTVTSAAAAVVAWLVGAWESIKGTAAAAWQGLVVLITSVWQLIKDTIRNAAQAVLDWLRSCWESAKSTASSAWNGLKSTVINVATGLVSWVSSLPGRILSALARLGSLLLGLGHDMVMGLWNGIKAGWDWLTGAVADLATGLLNAAKGALGIASPSKEFRKEVGRWIPEGMSVGIIANARVAADAARNMALGALSAGQAAASSAGITAGMGAGMAPTPGPRPLASVGVGRGEDGGPQYVVTINNPLPERSSSDINRAARTTAKLGG